MTPDLFYRAFVVPNLLEFEDEPGNVRKAFNAAVAAVQMADHWFYYWSEHAPAKVSAWSGKDGRRNFVKALSSAENCPEFAIVLNAANVYKHLYKPTKQAHIEFGSAGALEPAGIVQEVSSDGQVVEGGWNTETVVYPTKGGEKKPLQPAIRAVVDWWPTFFARY